MILKLQHKTLISLINFIFFSECLKKNVFLDRISCKNNTILTT